TRPSPPRRAGRTRGRTARRRGRLPRTPRAGPHGSRRVPRSRPQSSWVPDPRGSCRIVKVIDERFADRQDGRMVDTRSLNRSLLEAWRSVDAQVARALEAQGASDLSPRHAAALLLVERKGSRLTDLASRAGITKQAMMQV